MGTDDEEPTTIVSEPPIDVTDDEEPTTIVSEPTTDGTIPIIITTGETPFTFLTEETPLTTDTGATDSTESSEKETGSTPSWGFIPHRITRSDASPPTDSRSSPI